jgi:hypothetical protein
MYAFAPDLNPIFEDETLLPVQHADMHRGDRRNGEHRLLYAVLEDAVRCWQVYDGSTTARGQRLFGEAADWFASDDDSSPFTFVAICHLFSLDVDYVRDGLRRWSERNHQVKGKVVPFRVRRVSGTRHMVTGHAPGVAHG